MKLSRITTATVFLLTAWLALPNMVGSQTAPSTPPAAPGGNTSETYRQLSLFGEVLERIRSDYVEEVQDRQLIEDAVNGMLSSLDPHSSYMNARNYRDMQTQNRGEFGGLGIEVTMENGLVKVVSPIDDTPAARAGIRTNDLIIMLDGEQVQGLTLQEAVERMRGPINSQIKLTIRRGNQEPFEVTLSRARIVIQSVRSRVEGDFGYVRITSFTEQTDTGLRNAVQRIREQLGDRFKGLVLDLRNNPGGLLDQAIAVSDAFLERGEIVSTRGRRQEDAQRYNARPGDLINGLPLVVLINGGSASASEIVAGALQDHRRAIILGTRSFGKGSVQTIMPLGNQGAIRLTTARYFTPSGRSIQGLGIDPDIQVEQARLTAIDQPRMRREADLRGALSNPTQQQERQPQQNQQQAPQEQQPTPATPPAAQPAPAPTADDQTAPGDAQQDYQLSRALDLLRGIALYSARAAN
jgi:carboxyl-terminal processing protease